MIHKVQRRGGFADRNGIRVENTTIQYTSLDDRTRNALVNVVTRCCKAVLENIRETERIQKNQHFYRYIIGEVYGEIVDYNAVPDYNFWNIINGTIWKDTYDAVLTLVEAIVQFLVDCTNIKEIYTEFNNVFQKEYVGYRFIGRYIVRITDQNEIESINEALENPYSNVNEHISKAITLLSDRTNPDYENSIKESISAVEAMCAIILGDNKTTLGAALKKLEDSGLKIHPSLNTAFIKLYGYTSNASGIRHAGDIGGVASTFEEAKFMLVSCSAFVNYLKAVSATYLI